jgi:hypothetical protein
MYLSGMTTRQIGQELGINFKSAVNALKACRVKARPRGGLNNPSGYNG